MDGYISNMSGSDLSRAKHKGTIHIFYISLGCILLPSNSYIYIYIKCFNWLNESLCELNCHVWIVYILLYCKCYEFIFLQGNWIVQRAHGCTPII